MNKLEVVITFANDEKLYIKQDAIIFPIRLIEQDGEQFTSESSPVVLEEHLHNEEGLIPALTAAFSRSEFFYLNKDKQDNRIVYKTNSIVSLKQRKELKAGFGRIY
ncbi:hypothetical protein [Oceanobacillus oncorhynchi]|uniref:hypothetical protein n=1 Tax=Oceanobacillus oncorhynchi TaxID=545501 RepID=UPI0025A3B2A0|nr:hypothetical protein [Oceanobacillus oncorhynchi]MDM8100943.1 hypothetical protein [Oceanobacillus oncorhynchi]